MDDLKTLERLVKGKGVVSKEDNRSLYAISNRLCDDVFSRDTMAFARALFEDKARAEYDNWFRRFLILEKPIQRKNHFKLTQALQSYLKTATKKNEPPKQEKEGKLMLSRSGTTIVYFLWTRCLL